MIDIETARRIVFENTPVLEPLKRDIAAALGHVLAEEVAAQNPIPLFDSSAMDGYAVVCNDVAAASEESPVTLAVEGTVQAGGPLSQPLRSGCAFRIMTGAVVPPGAEAVVMKEYTDDLGDTVRIKRPARQGDNIRLKGEEYQTGDLVLSAGTLVTPPVVGMLATLNRTAVSVYRKPAVAVVVTGNELRPPGTELAPGQIRDANSFSLTAALRALGIEPVSARVVGDDRDAIRAALSAALEEADMVISVGGVSVGDFDFVKDVAEELGVKTLFWKIAIKPGKPNYFGKKGGRLVFGLPGNPVSVLVSFYELVKPALSRLAGLKDPARLLVRARLNGRLKKRGQRLEYVRGRLSRGTDGEWTVQPLKAQDSHMLGGLAGADCLILFPRDNNLLEDGAIVDVEPVFWSGP